VVLRIWQTSEEQVKDAARVAEQEELTQVWDAVIEDRGARGRVKRAFRGYAKHDVAMIQASTRDASPAVREAWLAFAPTWAEAEMKRLEAWVNTQRHLFPLRQSEKKRNKARVEKRNRTRGLAQKIVDHVEAAGGAIEFRPAMVARAVNGGKHVWKVNNVMRMLTKNGTAKMVAQSKGKSDRFVLRA